MTWRLYRHDDAGAPVLDTSKGSMINLLEKCLVTGYGTPEQPTDPPDIPWNVSKSADGLHAVFWTDDANGSGHYFYIRDDGENNGDAGDDQVKAHGRECYLQGALTFTGFTNGKPDLADVFPDPGSAPRGRSWQKNETQPRTVEWWLCADNRTVYVHWIGDSNAPSFIDGPNSWADRSRLTGFGDLIDLIDGAGVSFIDGNGGVNNNSLTSESILHNNPQHASLSTSPDGAPGSGVTCLDGGYHFANRNGAVSPTNLTDLSGPLWSRLRYLAYGNGESANLLRLRGVVELSLRLRDQPNNVQTVYEDLLGVPNGDPPFAEFSFAGMTLLALPFSAVPFNPNIMFLDKEDDQ